MPRVRSMCLYASLACAVICFGLQGARAVASSGGPVHPAGPLPLGMFSILSGITPPCLVGYSCTAFKVDKCPNVSQRARGVIATQAPTTTARGMVLFFSGSDGTSWWNSGTGTAGTFLNRVRADGFWTVQIEWMDAWVLSAPGEDSGSGHLACRPATVVRGVHDTMYAPLGIHSQPLTCGFCITGNSGGSAQVSYPLSFYGLDSILDGVIPTSGPTHTALAKGCLRNGGEEHYYYSDTELITIDDSFGYNMQPGACYNHDPSSTARWAEESVDTGANDLVYPTTRVQMIVGAKDCGSTPAHAADFYDALVAAQTPSVALNVIQNMGHSIQDSSKGLAALENALLGLPVPNGTPCYQLI